MITYNILDAMSIENVQFLVNYFILKTTVKQKERHPVEVSFFLSFKFRRITFQDNLLNCCKASLEVCDDVIDMLGTDRKTNGVLLDALISQLLVIQLRVSCGCGMDY